MLIKTITKAGAAFTIALTMPAMAADSEDGDVIALGTQTLLLASENLQVG